MDGLEIARFAAMLQSEAFLILRARIEAELDRARNDCENQCELVLMRAQGQAKALRTVLALPGMMLAEMKASQTK